MSSKGTSDIYMYVHKSIQAVHQETYLKECVDKRLLPQISFYLFWPKHITQILFKNV